MATKRKKTRSIKIGPFTGSLQKHPHGKSWYCSYYYTDASGKRVQSQRSLGCPIVSTTEAQAAEIMTQYLLALAKKTAAKINLKSTVVDVALAWIETTKPNIRTNTYERYRLNVKKICLYFEKHYTLVIDLDRSKVRAFQGYLATKGKINQKTKKPEPMAAASIRDVMSVLSQICEYAIDTGIIASNPCIGIRIKKQTKPIEKYMSFEQSKKFIDFCKENADNALTAVIIVAINLGLRKSEILGLRMEDLDLDNHRLTIRSTVTALTSLHYEKDTKTDTSNRIIPLSDEEVQFFMEYQNFKNSKKRWYKSAYHSSDFVFTLEDGTLYTPSGLYKRVKRLLVMFGEPELTFHSFRHTYASILYFKGVDIKTAQQLLGHSSPDTTLQIYTHISRSDVRSQNIGLLGGYNNEYTKNQKESINKKHSGKD